MMREVVLDANSNLKDGAGRARERRQRRPRRTEQMRAPQRPASDCPPLVSKTSSICYDPAMHWRMLTPDQWSALGTVVTRVKADRLSSALSRDASEQ